MGKLEGLCQKPHEKSNIEEVEDTDTEFWLANVGKKT